MNRKFIILWFAGLFYLTSSMANKLPKQFLVPGGIAKIILSNINQPAPKVFFWVKESRL